MKARRNARRPGKTAPQTTEVVGIYLIIFLPKPFQLASTNGEVKKRSRDSFHQQDDIRRCVACNVPVDNSNLGGHSRKSRVGRRSLVLPLRGLGRDL